MITEPKTTIHESDGNIITTLFKIANGVTKILSDALSSLCAKSLLFFLIKGLKIKEIKARMINGYTT